MTYTFTFDESACTGCKACQVACKDKNNLPLGVLWRRVYEITGGEWIHTGDAWESTIFAYNLSTSCNHCVHPKCAGVCPTDAYEVRPDGIVLINTKKCIGCGYCSWACPYDAPQIDDSAGYMTKCNMCYDYLDVGIPPACVAACPMRCLDLMEINEQGLDDKGLALWEIPGAGHPFPLPKYSRTEPHLVIKPHYGVKQAEEGVRISNREETSSAHLHPAKKKEIPLIFFTLLSQMSIGGLAIIFMINWFINDKLVVEKITSFPLLGSGVAIMMALFASFFHLGTPKNAWRTINHLKKSWLSKEILFSLGFAGLLAIYGGTRIFPIRSFPFEKIIVALTAFCGLVAVYSMYSVYRLRSVPSWNTSRTLLEFTISTFGLGCLLTAMLIPSEAPIGLIGWIILAGIISLSATGWVIITSAKTDNILLRKLRTALFLIGFLGEFGILVTLYFTKWGIAMIFIIILIEELIGRWLFYSRRKPGI